MVVTAEDPQILDRIRAATLAKLKKQSQFDYCGKNKNKARALQRFLKKHGWSWTTLPESMDDPKIRLPEQKFKPGESITKIDSETVERMLVYEYNKALKDGLSTIAIVDKISQFWAKRQKIQPKIEVQKVVISKKEEQMKIWDAKLHGKRKSKPKTIKLRKRTPGERLSA